MEALVTKMRGEAVCDSLQVAEKFRKEHKHVLDSIRDLTAENSAAKFFREGTYQSRGRNYPMYYMNRDGFSLLVMGFTGKEALQWKLKFIEAFNQMEMLLREKQTPVYQDTRTYQIQIRKEEADVIRQFVEYAASQGSRKAERYYINLSRLADKCAGISDRELATMQQLNILALAERIVAVCIREGIQRGNPYKEIYSGCKDRLESFRKIACLNG